MIFGIDNRIKLGQSIGDRKLPKVPKVSTSYFLGQIIIIGKTIIGKKIIGKTLIEKAIIGKTIDLMPNKTHLT